MKHKIILAILFFVLAIGHGYAQEIEVNLRVSPPFQLGLDGLTNQLLATVRNTNLEEPINNVNFRLELFGPKNLRIFSDRVFDDDIDLEAGEVRSFIGGDWEGLYDSTNLTIEPSSEKQRILDTQSLRDGVYKICLIAYSTINFQDLSNGVPSDCDDFTVEVPQPPKIILPLANHKIARDDSALQVNWFQNVITISPTYTLEIVDATQFPNSSFAVDEIFKQAESVFFEDGISSFSYVVEDVDWEEGHEYEIRVTSNFGRNEGVLYDDRTNSRPVRIRFEGNAVVADTYVPEPENDEIDPKIEEEITPPEDVVTEVVSTDTPSKLMVNDTLFAGDNGEFAVVLSKLTGTKASYNGEGSVFIDWLNANVKVSFKKITVADNKHLLSGTIIADINENPPTYPTDWAIGAANNLPWTNKTAGDIVKWAEDTSGQEVSYRGLSELNEAIKMPLGLNFSDNNKLVLTEMSFNKDKSQFNLIAAKTTPLTWGEAQTVGFIAKQIEFHPASIVPSPKRLELIADITIEDNNLDTSYTFIAPTNARTGCYLQWGENGISGFGLELESELSRDWLVPVNHNGTDRVKIALSAQSTDWDNVLFTGNLEPSLIVGSGGIEIKATNISYDMSDVLNPTGIVFPTNYTGETTTQFRGFYAENLKLKLPKAWETSSNGALEIDVTNMIIDNMGLTMNADATNVASFSSTSVVDMAASVDDVHIEIVANSLTDATINGKVALPISDVTEIKDDSKINYSASLHIATAQEIAQNKETYFQLVLSPTENQEIDFDLISSTFKIENTSNITATIGKDKLKFNADLSGEVSMSGIEIGPIALNSLDMKVEHLTFGYDSSPTGGFTFDKNKKMAWRFNSPQKYLSTNAENKGFEVNLHKVEYQDKTKETGEVMRGALQLTTTVVLSNNIGGSASIEVIGAIKKAENSFFKPVYVDTRLDSISVNVELSAVHIVGNLGIRDNDPTYGDGIIGTLDAQFKTIGGSVRAMAAFGTVDDYKYWSVQAGLDLPKPIVLAPGIAFKGFGGGAYHNMKATKNASANASWAKKYTFTPKKNLAGLSLMARLVAPKEETYNADVEIIAVIGTGPNAGLRKIDINGNLWVGTTIEKRSEASIKGIVNVNYDFVKSIFDLQAIATVNMPVITAEGYGMHMNADGSKGTWFFKFGTPAKPNSLNVNLLGLSYNSDSYFMFGNHIPTPKGFTSNFQNGYNATLGNYPTEDGVLPTEEASSPGSNASHGAGIALGLGFNFEGGGYFRVAGDFHVGIQGTAGAELNLSLLEYPYLRDQKPTSLGYNGWQAGGSIGFYASVGAGVYKKSGTKYSSFAEIASFSGGGYISGAFPNPSWVRGELSGRVKLLCLGGCLINSRVDVPFEFGEESYTGAADVVVQEAESNTLTVDKNDKVLESIDKHIVKYVHPKTPFSFSPTTPISVKYHTKPNEFFELPDLGRVRTFVFCTSITLTEINPESCEPNILSLRVTTNNIGEQLYTAKSKLNWATEGMYSIDNQSILNDYATNSFHAASGRTIPNNLAPQTNYKFEIYTVLKEWINGEWEFAEIENKKIEESVEYKFRTGGTIKTNELIAADNMFEQALLSDYLAQDTDNAPTQSGELLLQLNFTTISKDFDAKFISDDGLCECNQINVRQKLNGHYSERMKESGAEFKDRFSNPHDPLAQVTSGSENSEIAYTPPTSYRDYPSIQPSGETIESSEDAIQYFPKLSNNTLHSTLTRYNSGTLNNTTYSPTTYDYSAINKAKNGSFISLK